MTFGSYLKDKLGNGELSSKSIIAKLQLNDSTFEKLDPVTLSRWINGRTTPALEKQLSVMQCFEPALYPYLKYIPAPAVPRSYRKVYEAVFDNIESSYHSIFALKDASASGLTLSFEHLDWSQFLNSVPGFFEATRSYSRVSLDKKKAHSDCVTFCSLSNESRVVSHLSVSSDIECLKTIFGKELNVDTQKKAVVFNIGYFICREHYNILLGLLLNHVCSVYEKIDDFYMVVRGRDFLSLGESFGGKLISANKESDVVGNIYLLKLDFIKTLSNPFIFSLLKSSYTKYQEMIECES
ncbi:hypothetical protein [Vibrio campbellii]|uniref:hypothetical protein n=1 Tax=Vibrio campbellii TaxID=680 RepID=UPI0005EE5572|nr:hypothetical protein [Vibrio campbellii]